MNWLDWALLVALILSAFAGMRVGLFNAALGFGSLLVGWYFAGQVSTTVGLAVAVYTDSTTVQAVVSVLVYVLLLAIMLYAASRVIAIFKSFLSTATMGASNILDRVGGLALGFLVGLMLIGAVVLIGARLTYQVDLGAIDHDVPGQLAERVAQEETVHKELEDFLGTSKVVGALVRLAVALPGKALGLAPAEFGDSLVLLEEALD